MTRGVNKDRRQELKDGKARTALSLSEKGSTHREIADVVGCRPDQVKGLLEYAERMKTVWQT